MYLKSTVLLLGSAAFFGNAVASPSISRVTTPQTDKRQVQEITSELGCEAKGPLAGPWAVELFTCQTGSNYTCQATDLTGCTSGEVDNIDKLLVLDSTTGIPLSVAAHIVEAYFKCPENGLVQCAVHFANNGSQSADYGLRITNATAGTPFTNATFGAPESESEVETTSDSLSTSESESTDTLGSGSLSDESSTSGPTSGFSEDESTETGTEVGTTETSTETGITETGTETGTIETDSMETEASTSDGFSDQAFGSDTDGSLTGFGSRPTDGFDF